MRKKNNPSRLFLKRKEKLANRQKTTKATFTLQRANFFDRLKNKFVPLGVPCDPPVKVFSQSKIHPVPSRVDVA